MPFEQDDPDKEFKILVLGALNWLFAAIASGEDRQQEFQKYYTEDWSPRQRKLIEQLNSLRRG